MQKNNYTKFKELKISILKQVNEGLDVVLAEGYGKIEIPIDLSRKFIRVNVTHKGSKTITLEGKVI